LVPKDRHVGYIQRPRKKFASGRLALKGDKGHSADGWHSGTFDDYGAIAFRLTTTPVLQRSPLLDCKVAQICSQLVPHAAKNGDALFI
jgi:hypothetical protein